MVVLKIHRFILIYVLTSVLGEDCYTVNTTYWVCPTEVTRPVAAYECSQRYSYTLLQPRLATEFNFWNNYLFSSKSYWIGAVGLSAMKSYVWENTTSSVPSSYFPNGIPSSIGVSDCVSFERQKSTSGDDVYGLLGGSCTQSKAFVCQKPLDTTSPITTPIQAVPSPTLSTLAIPESTNSNTLSPLDAILIMTGSTSLTPDLTPEVQLAVLRQSDTSYYPAESSITIVGSDNTIIWNTNIQEYKNVLIFTSITNESSSTLSENIYASEASSTLSTEDIYTSEASSTLSTENIYASETSSTITTENIHAYKSSSTASTDFQPSFPNLSTITTFEFHSTLSTVAKSDPILTSPTASSSEPGLAISIDPILSTLLASSPTLFMNTTAELMLILSTNTETQPRKTIPTGLSEPIQTIPLSGFSEPLKTILLSGLSEPIQTIPLSGLSETSKTIPLSGISEPLKTIPLSGISEPLKTIPLSGISEPLKTIPLSGLSEPSKTISITGLSELSLILSAVSTSEMVQHLSVTVVSEPSLNLLPTRATDYQAALSSNLLLEPSSSSLLIQGSKPSEASTMAYTDSSVSESNPRLTESLETLATTKSVAALHPVDTQLTSFYHLSSTTYSSFQLSTSEYPDTLATTYSMSPSTNVSTLSTVLYSSSVPSYTTTAAVTLTTSEESTPSTSTTTSNIKSPSSMCSCRCDSKSSNVVTLTHANIQQLVQEIQTQLHEDKKNLSSTVRQLTSAEDTRKSAQTVGSLAVVILVIVFSSLVLLDLTRLVQCIIRQSPDREDNSESLNNRSHSSYTYRSCKL